MKSVGAVVCCSSNADFFNCDIKDVEKRRAMLRDDLIEILKENNVDGAFIVRNMEDGRTVQYNENKVVPSASLIKMFIMINAFERIREGSLWFDTEIPVEESDIVDFSVLKFLKPRKYQLEELLRLMIVYSDNTATNVLMDHFGMEDINGTIKRMGCDDTTMQRKMMDFEAAAAGKQNYTTAADVFSLMDRLYRGTLLGAGYDDGMLEIMQGQSDEEMMRRYLPDEIQIARKSGELEGLNHEIAIVSTEKLDYIYVFFTWGGTDCNQTRDIIAKTSKMVYDRFMA